MDVDLGIQYRTARERITSLVTAPGVDADLIVPATPEWTVHDVIAHLAGVSEDATTGNMADAPSDPWTAAQVARGRGRTIDELISDWTERSPMMEAFFSSPDGMSMGAGVVDVHTHEADLRHALGLPLDVPADLLGWVGPMLRDRFAGRVEAAGLAPIQPMMSAVEWFRGALGRRTEDEVRAHLATATTDPDPYLAQFFIFGRAATSLGER